MSLSYRSIAEAAQGRLIGDDGLFQSASTDSRRSQADDLFIALRGEHFDAHDFLGQAVACGAKAVMVDHECEVNVTQIVVPDTRLGLGALAKLWRQQFRPPMIAITGSNGKTTVKEMLASILKRMGETLVTQGNLNNDIGVPLTLLRLRDDHRYAVIEMGANHPGEIRYLAGLAEPDVGLITNAGPAHLEGFGDIEGVARAKGELFEQLSEPQIAVINADDQYASLWRKSASRCRRLEFGLEHGDVAVKGAWQPDFSRLLIDTAQGSCEITLPVPGIHNARNALAAAAAAAAVGAGPAEIKAGLEAMQPVKGRLYPRTGVHGMKILDDTYNANPESLRAALEVVAAMPGEAWLILGDMGELGAAGPELHGRMGESAMQHGIRRLFALGPLSALAAERFGANAHHYAADQYQALIRDVRAAAAQSSGTTVNLLVKGSRAMRMERIVAGLSADENAPSPKAVES
ncbi:MAG TPA: UDP-N-acetylmuramoyl-tripeptide--D-alanyl-D-alanine ligase [Gammaproteobacteria bacterium]